MCANKSVILHGEHVIHETLDRMENWWMPNIEQLNDRTSPEILRFMSHSTPDVSRDLPPQQDFNKFLHLSGNSGRKNTDHVVDCWKRHPFWPQLTVGSTKTAQQFGILHSMDPQKHSNCRFQHAVSHGVHLCPSQMEGYGHYINEARSLGALVVTTDAPPMNEFVEEGVSGLMFPVRHSVENAPGSLNFNLTFPPNFVYPVNFRANLICQAIKQKVLKMPLGERESAYERDTEEMVEWKRVETLLHTELISSL
ncbi:hypothetical protein BDR26DRAFT_862733 [Obelidium mucronatum]|nr:hypothetical protein BDR26DRAFT_862733 [Obelidium mucronatum]